RASAAPTAAMADRRAAAGPEADAPAPPPELPAVSQPLLTVVPTARNVVPFRAAAPAGDKRPALSPVERTNFREIAKVLGAPEEEEEGRATGEADPTGDTSLDAAAGRASGGQGKPAD